MGLFDKLKNVFFEEEIIEVEEPVKKEKVTVAKKIETPETKKAKEEAIKREKEIELDEVEVKEIVKEIEKVEEKREVKEREKEKRFPMDFDEKDFTVEEREAPVVVEKKEEVVVRREKEVPAYQEKSVYRETIYPDKPVYQEKIEYEEVSVGGNDYQSVSYQGLYEGSEKREKKNNFTPSPIISPIYGILDKNYKKEEIVTKKEVRLSVASTKKVDVDFVREKAYGDLANDITESMHEEVKIEEDIVEQEDDNSLLYDLNEDDSPAVKVVTMGDAEEYFNDLGLEYNVDYKVEKEKVEEEKPVTRRSERNKDITVEDEIVRTYEKDLPEDESNLFDLIDSMYDDKEW